MSTDSQGLHVAYDWVLENQPKLEDANIGWMIDVTYNYERALEWIELYESIMLRALFDIDCVYPDAGAACPMLVRKECVGYAKGDYGNYIIADAHKEVLWRVYAECVRKTISRVSRIPRELALAPQPICALIQLEEELTAHARNSGASLKFGKVVLTGEESDRTSGGSTVFSKLIYQKAEARLSFLIDYTGVVGDYGDWYQTVSGRLFRLFGAERANLSWLDTMLGIRESHGIVVVRLPLIMNKPAPVWDRYSRKLMELLGPVHRGY